MLKDKDDGIKMHAYMIGDKLAADCPVLLDAYIGMLYFRKRYRDELDSYAISLKQIDELDKIGQIKTHWDEVLSYVSTEAREISDLIPQRLDEFF